MVSRRIPLAWMPLLNAEELLPDLWRIEVPLSWASVPAVNVYLVKGGRKVALVDAGPPGRASLEMLNSAISRTGTVAAAIDFVFLTHAHVDHIGGAGELAQASGATVLIHERERLTRPTGRRTFQMWHDWLRKLGVPEQRIESMVTRDRMPDAVSLLDGAVEQLAGGESFAIGRYRLRVLSTPGHTPGHISLLDERRGLLISGDHILPTLNPNVSLQSFGTNPMRSYLQSLRCIAGMQIGVTLPGHGQPIPRGSERAGEILAHQLKRRAQLTRALRRSPRTPYQLARELWSHASARHWALMSPLLRRNAITTTAAHLELLVDEGLASRSDGESVRYSKPV